MTYGANTIQPEQRVAGVLEFREDAAGTTSEDIWIHVVVRYDSTAGAANRLRVYRNGVQLTPSSPTNPALNTVINLFRNGYQHQIGAEIDNDNADYTECKVAFIDVVDGASLAPTSFAFDDGGTWTRLAYAGSYGTYGFAIDGTDGFNDVGPNGQNFTGVNMTTGGNLDTGDLPPYTN
jgi:hypothetical protein